MTPEVGEVGVDLPKRAEHLSPHALSVWAQCPAQWWYEYVAGVRDNEAKFATVIGSFVHLVLERLMAVAPGRRTEAMMKSIATDCWPTALEEWRDSFPLPVEGKQKAWRSLLLYRRNVDPDRVEVLATELKIEAEVAGVPVLAYVDLVERIDDVVVATDYKTGAPPEVGKPWTAARRAERLVQPRLYAAALTNIGAYDVGRARLMYLHVEGERARYDEIGCITDDEDQADVLALLQQVWLETRTAIADGGGEPNPGPLCAWCPAVELCDTGSDHVRMLWDQRRPSGQRKVRTDAPAVAKLRLTDTD